MTTRALSMILLAACTGEIDGSGGGDDAPPPPVTCEQPRTYTGFGGPLGGDRPAIEAGSDRVRLKPFTALAAEYARALGLDAFDTRTYAATFGRAPARWYEEPGASANTVYAAFALAFDACTRHTATAAYYAEAPTAQNAGGLCRDFALRAWQRDATDDEAAACVKYAVEQTPATDDPRRRWAYACASVLTASGFLTY